MFCFCCFGSWSVKGRLWYPFRNTDFPEKSCQSFSAAETLHPSVDTEWARGWFKYHIHCFCRWAKPAAISNEHWQERIWEHPRSLFVFFWRTTFQNPWGVPRGSLLSFFSIITFSVSLFMPFSRYVVTILVAKNKLFVCLSHHQPSSLRLLSSWHWCHQAVPQMHRRSRKKLGRSLFPVTGSTNISIRSGGPKSPLRVLWTWGKIKKISLLFETSLSWFCTHYRENMCV